MQTEEKVWEQVQQFYKETFGLEPYMVDMMIDHPILKMCAAGSSNKTIAEFIGTTDSIEDVLDKHFGFRGWSVDLEFSPIRIYNELGRCDEQTFVDQIVIRFGNLMNIDIHNMYKACVAFTNIERMLDETWI